MKQVFQNPKTGKTRVEEIIPPVLKSGGVLVRNYFSTVSVGTERNIIELSKKSLLQKAKERPDYVQKFWMLAKTKGIQWAWKVAQSKLATDIALGYSSAGDVLTVGERVDEFRVGDRVACAGQDYASHAEFVFVPKNLCVRIPDAVSYEEAAFVTLGSIALQGIRRAGLTQGDKVAVIGLGLLGQLAVRMLTAYGHSVIGFDVNSEQVAFGLQNGLQAGGVIGKDDVHRMAQDFTEGRGVDVTLVYASTKSDEPLQLAAQIARDRGTIVQIGNVLAHIPWRDFVQKELSYFSSRSYGPGRYDPNYEERGEDYPFSYVRWTERRNMEEFLRLIAMHRIQVRDLITRTFAIEEAGQAYALVSEPRGLLHAIQLSYPKDATLHDTISFSRILSSRPLHGVLRVALVGIGSFMKSEILPHLKKVPGVEIRAICHSKGLPAKELADSWGAHYVTSDYQKVLNDADIDFVVCATRHSIHATMVSQALAVGKHVYVEKPLALNKEELDAVMESARQSEGKLFVGFNRRFSPHFVRARREFHGKGPLMILYRVNYPLAEKNHWSYDAKEGGRLLGEGCHFIDAFQYITHSTPRRVWTSMIPVKGAVTREENFSVNVEFLDGSIGTLFYSALGSFRLPKEYIEVYGGGVTMVIDNFKDARIIFPTKEEKMNLRHQGKGYLEELTAFIEAARGKGDVPVSLEELYTSHMATLAMLESLRTGKPVEI